MRPLLNKTALPEWYDEEYDRLARAGRRVIALAHRTLGPSQPEGTAILYDTIRYCTVRCGVARGVSFRRMCDDWCCLVFSIRNCAGVGRAEQPWIGGCGGDDKTQHGTTVDLMCSVPLFMLITNCVIRESRGQHHSRYNIRALTVHFTLICAGRFSARHARSCSVQETPKTPIDVRGCGPDGTSAARRSRVFSSTSHHPSPRRLHCIIFPQAPVVLLLSNSFYPFVLDC